MTLPEQTPPDQAELGGIVRDHWKAFLIEGLVLAALGLAAIVVPAAAGLAVAILLGWMFLVSGVVQLILSFNARALPGFGWSLVSSILAIAAGAVLLIWPTQGVVSLAAIIGIYFVMEGVATVMYALAHRRELTARWSLLLIAGIADIIVSGIIVSGLPGSASWAIGLLVGINLIFGGGSLVAMALAARPSST